MPHERSLRLRRHLSGHVGSESAKELQRAGAQGEDFGLLHDVSARALHDHPLAPAVALAHAAAVGSHPRASRTRS